MCGCWVVSNSFALLWSYLNSHDWLNHWGAQVELRWLSKSLFSPSLFLLCILWSQKLHNSILNQGLVASFSARPFISVPWFAIYLWRRQSVGYYYYYYYYTFLHEWMSNNKRPVNQPETAGGNTPLIYTLILILYAASVAHPRRLAKNNSKNPPS